MLLETGTVLSPGRVVAVEAARVRLDLGEQEVSAVLALAYPYRPCAGDLLLAIGQGDQYFVIGVIEGAGTTTFTAPGLLEFRAPQGIRLAGGRVEVIAQELDVKAESQSETVGESHRRVHGVADLRAGEIRQHAEELYRVKAETIVEVAEKDVKIDAEKIRLG